ncbi:MAG: hypothetical protein EOO25_02025 [Comamonadaceae bacterium]|nr:MAG: hypothetical protein EOO25_02025 [Comamonadaceae bacterium]
MLTHANGVEAYFCDGKRSYWFKGAASDGVLELQEASGAKLLLELAGDVVVGRLVADGATTRFDLPQVNGNVLFRSDSFAGDTRVLGGWIVLPDGEQRGAIKINTTVIDSTLLDGKVVCANCVAFSSAMTPAPFTPATALRTANTAQKFTVIGFGDSFMSGEGAPVTPGALVQTAAVGIEEISQGIGIQETWSNGLPTSRSHNFNLTSAERSQLEREAKACHRGVSGLGAAVDALRTSWPATVEIIHQTFACSGAKVAELVGTFYGGPGGCSSRTGADRDTCLRFADDMPTASIRPQVPAAADFLAAQRLNADAVVMSIGGNDLGFGTVLADCLSPLSDCVKPDSDARKALKNGKEKLPGRYLELARKFADNGIVADNVFLTSHMNPLRQTSGICAGSDFLPDLLLVNMSDEDAEFAITVLGDINGQVASAVAAHRWKPITSHLGSEVGHGLCTDQPWYNHRNAALFTQGRDLPNDSGLFSFLADNSSAVRIDLSAGMFHPNARGQREGYMPAYRDVLDGKLVARFTPRPPSGFRPVAFKIENGQRQVTLRWNDTNAFESKHVLTNAVGGAVTNAAADSTETTITLPGTTGSFKLKACFNGARELCSSDQPAVEVEVKVPTHTPRINFNGPMIPADGGGPDLSRATEVRVGWDDAAPSRLYSTVEVDKSGSITRLASLGSGMVFPVDGATRRVRVAACNTLGCGPASAWTDVATPPAFQLPPVCVPPKRPLLNGCR